MGTVPRRREQSWATTPSAQAVSALARALRLSPAERDQFYRAAGLLAPRDQTVGTHVPPSIRRLVDRLGDLRIVTCTAAPGTSRADRHASVDVHDRQFGGRSS